MTLSQDFETIGHDQRGRTEQRVTDPAESGTRTLYSFVGLLIGSIGAMIGKLAFPVKPNVDAELPYDEGTNHPDRRETVDEDNSDELQLQEAAAAGSGAAAAGHANSGNSRPVLPASEGAPVPLHGERPFHMAMSSSPANDNLSMRLPLSAPGSGHTAGMQGDTGASAGGPSGRDNEHHEHDDGGRDPVGTGSGPNTRPSDNDVDGPGPSRNRAPLVSGSVNLGQLYVNTAVVIGLSDLLAHASDPDGDALSIAGLTASSGSLTHNGDNTWTFTPDAGNASDIVFSYFVTDGQATTAQTATLDLVNAPTLWTFGTPGDDVMVGSEEDDQIAALGGSDIVEARGGDDEIDASDGNDIISGGAGNDVIQGGNGNDVIDGGAGDDIILAGNGDDLVFGGSGDDVIAGGTGNDVIEAGTGNDVVDGGDGKDIIRATIGSGTSSEILQEPTTNQTMASAPTASTTLRPASSAANDGNDVYDGGEGIDTLDLSAATLTIKIDMTAGTVTGAEIGNDQIINIENVVTGSGDNEINCDAEANVVIAGAGDDDVELGAGDDVAVATNLDGNDTYDGGDGVDTLDLSATAADSVVDLDAGTATSAAIGTDTIEDIENVIGGSGDDTFIANEEQNEFTGGDGADTFVFASTSDSDASEGETDHITDFEVGDKIDVSAIDADETKSGQQLFEFAGEKEKFEKAGELRFRHESQEDGDHTIVLGNTDDDLDEDFAIDLWGWYSLSASDFSGLT